MNKCSLENHKENDSISYCKECKIYMCNKCFKLHSELFLNHHTNNLEREDNICENYTGMCQENNHPYESNFFCKIHNKLCCGLCITKIKGNYFGQHTDCQICTLEEIENEKKLKLKKNIKILEELSNGFGNSIDDLKAIFEKINNNKEKIKNKIIEIFNNIKNALNERKDKLLEMVDNRYDELYFDINVIKKAEKLPNKIEEYLGKGKLIDNQWKDNKLNYLINSCIIIENKIKEFNKINNKVEKCKKQNISIFFNSNDEELIEKINNFGNIEDDSKIESIHNSKLFRDGSSTDDFHNKYDNNSPKKTLIETQKGNKSPDQIELEWGNDSDSNKSKSSPIYICDSDNGSFSHNNQEIIDIEKKDLNKETGNNDNWGGNNNFFLGRKKNDVDFWEKNI